MLQAPARRFHCLLLGEEPLVAHCAELLLERGHTVAGLVTRAPFLSRWAAAHGVAVLTRAGYPELLASGSVELLFSITHPARISGADLTCATVAAINYHDGPLPSYAGLNASAWAIVNGEPHHAVVWHHMVPEIDAGPILERRRFELEEHETSISLNMRNAALARESFRALLGRLERGDDHATPQDADGPRTVYASFDRPAALCTVDWTSAATTMDRLIRACDFGNYPNRFGLAKIVHGDRAVGVRQSMPLGEAAGGPAGTLLSIAPDHLDFACGVGALRLSHFSTLTGVTLTAAQAASALRLGAGERVHDPLRAARVPLNRLVAEAEPYFVAALRDAVVPELPFERSPPSLPTEVEVILPLSFWGRFSGDRESACMALYGLVWSCLLRQDVFDVALADPEARRPLAAGGDLLSPAVPLRISISPALGFADLSTAPRRLLAAAVARRRLSGRPHRAASGAVGAGTPATAASVTAGRDAGGRGAPARRRHWYGDHRPRRSSRE